MTGIEPAFSWEAIADGQVWTPTDLNGRSTEAAPKPSTDADGRNQLRMLDGRWIRGSANEMYHET